MEDILKDSRIIAALITAIVTFIISIISSVISLVTSYRHRKLIKEIEYLKSELQKKNISYQIYQTELAKRRFDKLDVLYTKLVEYSTFQSNKVNTDYNMFVDPKELVKQSRSLHLETRTVFLKSRIFLNDQLKNSIFEFLKACNDLTENYSLRENNRDKKSWNKYFEAMEKNANKIQPAIEEIERLMKEYLNETK